MNFPNASQGHSGVPYFAESFAAILHLTCTCIHPLQLLTISSLLAHCFQSVLHDGDAGCSGAAAFCGGLELLPFLEESLPQMASRIIPVRISREAVKHPPFAGFLERDQV
jgi:hypothetical protein